MEKNLSSKAGLLSLRTGEADGPYGQKERNRLKEADCTKPVGSRQLRSLSQGTQFETEKQGDDLLSKSKPKPEKAKARKELHVCGVINGVMGKGAFSKEGKKFLCVECGKAHDKLPEGYLEAKKKLNPKTAALLEKGSRTKTTGAEHVKWSLAGKKAWATRIKNQAAAKNKAKKTSKN